MLNKTSVSSLLKKGSTQGASRVETPGSSGIRTAHEISRRRAAYSAIVDLHESGLLRAALRLCVGDNDRAQDLVQDALIRGYEAYLDGRFQDGTNARAWLLRILTNQFITEHNRRRRWEAGIDLDTLSSEGDAGPACLRAGPAYLPETALLEATLDEPLERALSRLSADMRACVVLVDIEGAGYIEAAAALGVPVGTVRSRLSRARLQLHASLYNYAHERRRV